MNTILSVQQAYYDLIAAAITSPCNSGPGTRATARLGKTNSGSKSGRWRPSMKLKPNPRPPAPKPI